VVINIHGGGWTGGTKDEEYLNLLPYLEMGFNAVNVEYRLADVALAPAAVADCRCALRWVYANARRFGFDTSKIVVTGRSAGGHLALTTGMLPQDAGLDFECSQGPHDRPLSVAAIVNFYGIADVNDLLFGKPNEKSYAVRWLGSQENKEEIARRASPLSYVRAGLPPILTIHGDRDPTVPYEHALRLKAALTAAGVPNQLHTVIGGGHGGFNPDQSIEIHRVIRAFLKEHGIL
jgi:acetyl esterase/lipase